MSTTRRTTITGSSLLGVLYGAHFFVINNVLIKRKTTTKIKLDDDYFHVVLNMYYAKYHIKPGTGIVRKNNRFWNISKREPSIENFV